MTKTHYTDRVSKARYVWTRFNDILDGATILDVGADECHLRKYVGVHGSYWGIGYGSVDQYLDLEQGNLPFSSRSFDVVLCLDVLEHLEHLHDIFDELCRVSRRYILISLPNPLSELMARLRSGPYSDDMLMKFYGLPVDNAGDRHRWFFSSTEAKRFINIRSRMNGWKVRTLEVESSSYGWRRFMKVAILRVLFSRTIQEESLLDGTLWAVLERV